MKTKQKAPKEHGIISIVQSPDTGKKTKKLSKENNSDKLQEDGIISIVQSPDDDKSRENK